MPTTPSRQKQDNNITKFEIYPNGGGSPIDVSQGVTELSYYENILSETVRASAVIVDTGRALGGDDGTGGKIGIDDGLKLGNGEKVLLEFEDGFPTPNKLKFVGKNEFHLNQKIKIGEHTQKAIYSFELVSKEFLKNETQRVIKRYDGKISDSAQKILKEVVKTQKKVDIEPTENKYNFIGTTKKPFWTLLWLAKKSIPTKGGKRGKSAGFLFFENYDGFLFKSIDGLFDTEPVKKYIYNNTTSSVVPTGYDDNILDFTASDSSDFQSKLMMGTYNSANKGFDSFKSKYDENPLDIETQKSGVKYPGTQYVFINKDFIADPSRFSYSFKSVGFLPDGHTLPKQLEKCKTLDINKAETINQAQSRYNQLFTVSLQITIPGDFSLRAGNLIYCDFPELTSKPTPKSNPRMSGIYMISALCHRVASSETYTSLELIRDSYGRKPF
jgi:hypothetical protein